MRDPRNAQLARVIVGHSTRLEPGEAVLIEAFDVSDGLVSDLIANTRKVIAEAGISSVKAVRQHPRRLVAFSAQVEQERRQIKAFLYENVYFSADLKADKKKAEGVITELFEFFMKTPEELSSNYQEKLLHEPLHRVVCDYIAGMTDNYVQDQHRRFCSDRKKAFSM